jgi:hypothetical protein
MIPVFDRARDGKNHRKFLSSYEELYAGGLVGDDAKQAVPQIFVPNTFVHILGCGHQGQKM